jgi:hypothetical protein
MQDAFSRVGANGVLVKRRDAKASIHPGLTFQAPDLTYLATAWALFADGWSVLQNGCRLAKRNRVMQECNSLRNNQPETHRDDDAGSGDFAVP